MPPKVKQANEVGIVWQFLAADYALVRDGTGKIWLVKDEHRVPVYAGTALFFETRHSSLIRSEA